MREPTPLQFTCAARERDIRGICAVHGVPFKALEEVMNEMHILVSPGSVDLAAVEIGQARFMANPSEELERAYYAFLRGFTLAMEHQGIGKRLPRPGQDQPDALDEFHAWFEREHWLQFVK